jgi:methylthioribose-1-phosphate isomerase
VKVGGVPYRTIWVGKDQASVEVIDQTKLPHEFAIVALRTADDVYGAIGRMTVRGAPLIGAAGAYGVWLAALQNPGSFERAANSIVFARPTAVNLGWAIDRMVDALKLAPTSARADIGRKLADGIADEDVRINQSIGQHGAKLIEDVHHRTGASRPVQVLTHCNAGWLATVDYGTALAPVYVAHDRGIPVHVWVSETRPRNQGALTAWELAEHGVPHTYVVDNAAGHLMRSGLVDLCIVGTDRTTANGDVANKIGTYLKALAAKDCDIPFYVAAPSPSIDWSADSGARIPIEERPSGEVSEVRGIRWVSAGWRQAFPDKENPIDSLCVTTDETPVRNPGFDVTPARLVTGLITERGVCAASPEGLGGLFPGLAKG